MTESADLLEAQAAALEAQATGYMEKAKEVRVLAGRLREILGDLPAGERKLLGAPEQGAAPSNGKSRTFVCRSCNRTCSAAPRGMIPKICKACKGGQDQKNG